MKRLRNMRMIHALLCQTGLLTSAVLMTVFCLAPEAVAGDRITINFDDLPTWNGYTYEKPIPNGYNGFQWNNFGVMDVVDTVGTSGYPNCLVSRKNLAFNSWGLAATLSSSASFDLNSAYLGSAWRDGMTVEVQGFSGSTLAYDRNYTLTTSMPTFIEFDFLGITSANFIASGGTPVYGVDQTSFAMDDLTVTVVPEPSAGILAVVGAISLLGCRCRRRRS